MTATANGMAGRPYLVTAIAMDATSVAFMLTNIAPTITLSPPTLSAGTKGIAYFMTLMATGGGRLPACVSNRLEDCYHRHTHQHASLRNPR
ncbi:MAG: hypothetical protein M3Y58_10840 [Chloroflexota bacterium]|nr:hypothetical protein [Chloroflexota bacterium]